MDFIRLIIIFSKLLIVTGYLNISQFILQDSINHSFFVSENFPVSVKYKAPTTFPPTIC
jgi:hypothetical protein